MEEARVRELIQEALRNLPTRSDFEVLEGRMNANGIPDIRREWETLKRAISQHGWEMEQEFSRKLANTNTDGIRLYVDEELSRFRASLLSVDKAFSSLSDKQRKSEDDIRNLERSRTPLLERLLEALNVHGDDEPSSDFYDLLDEWKASKPSSSDIKAVADSLVKRDFFYLAEHIRKLEKKL